VRLDQVAVFLFSVGDPNSVIRIREHLNQVDLEQNYGLLALDVQPTLVSSSGSCFIKTVCKNGSRHSFQWKVSCVEHSFIEIFHFRSCKCYRHQIWLCIFFWTNIYVYGQQAFRGCKQQNCSSGHEPFHVLFLSRVGRIMCPVVV
jgi:hypothetical protein